MAAKKKSRNPKSKIGGTVPIEVRRHHALAICIGYNELAKAAVSLDEKSYYRYARDQAVIDFEKLGGNKDLFAAPATPVLTIDMPGGPPHIVFRESDIELMREAVRRYTDRTKTFSDTFELAIQACQKVVEGFENWAHSEAGTTTDRGAIEGARSCIQAIQSLRNV